jgi:hypothetical protein
MLQSGSNKEREREREYELFCNKVVLKLTFKRIGLFWLRRRLSDGLL